MADGTGRGKNHSFSAIRLRVRGNWRSVEYLLKYLGHVYAKLERVTGSGAGFILPNIEEDDSEKRNL